MRQYLLAVHDSADGSATLSEAEIEVVYKQVDDFNAIVKDAGAWVFAGGLEPADKAKVVDAAKGSPVTTDGPYAETKEQLGGFWVIQAEDDAAALEWAKQASAACMGPVEVRPFQDDPGA